VLGLVGERRFPLPEFDASVPEVAHEVRHRPDGDPRRDRFRERETRILEGRQRKLDAEFVEFSERLDRQNRPVIVNLEEIQSSAA